ncbi:hypothetical protein GCM10010961_39490 [Pseudodonghicola xiamenensis]|uniref:Glycosyl transferase family 2 n=2 Tax=Pseudodonghicola xiamenensis TaxID=337702 RepID=A0A8J3HCI1_9RHOB|nr:hypothetical protein GCM10010961_39490 [Pseudodonghicola xiamenensis]
MVYRDHWALAQWYRHYARHLGAENLFIVAHGADPTLSMLCPKATILPLPRDRLDGFDTLRDTVLNGFQAGLGAVYDWVIRTDADELICLDPDIHPNFSTLLEGQPSDAIFALGMNVAERPGDPRIGEGKAALPLRPAIAFSGHYSKAWAARNGMALARHGIALRPARAARYPFVLPRGVYLAHLKYASRRALNAANEHRREIATGPGRALPGSAWAKPKLTARKFYSDFEALPERPWQDCEPEAWERISTAPQRDLKKGLLRAQNIRPECRTTLPQRILSF